MPGTLIGSSNMEDAKISLTCILHADESRVESECYNFYCQTTPKSK